MRRLKTTLALVVACTFGAGGAVAAPETDATLFGVTIDRQVESYPSCASEEGRNKICLHPGAETSAKTRFIELRPDRPDYIRSNFMIGTRADGTIKFASIDTGGAKYQDEIFDRLVTRYGKPSTIKRSVVQNGFGATFEKIDASWKLKGGMLLFRGIEDRLDAGNIGLVSDHP